MTLHHGDCLDVMAGMEPESVDAIVTDPPYMLRFMGKSWDSPTVLVGHAKPDPDSTGFYGDKATGKEHDHGFAQWQPHPMQAWHQQWAEAAYRVAKPSAHLLAFGGTRTVHRMTVALEDAGWIIRDLLVWAYASGFPKSKASLKPAWEPIVMARKPGPLRMLAIDECRIGTTKDVPASPNRFETTGQARGEGWGFGVNKQDSTEGWNPNSGRWPANVILTDPIFDGGIEGVVGGGEVAASGTYSRFFLIPKADRADREPVLGGLPARELRTMGDGVGEYTRHAPGAIQRQNHHPTVKPVDLMRYLVRLVTPSGGIVLDPFLGSGTTAIAAEMEGFEWIGIEKEAEYVAIAEARLNGTQRGLGLGA